MNDLNEERKKRDELVKQIKRQNRALYRARLKAYQNYQSIVDKEQNTDEDEVLTELEAEQLGIVVSITISCYSCMEQHIKAAINIGATYDQLLRAVEVGIKEAGVDIIEAQYAMDILETYKDQSES